MEGTDGRQQVIERYEQHKKNWNSKTRQLKTQSRLVAWLRLAFFIASFVVPFSFLESWGSVFFLVFGLLFLIFLGLVYYAHKLNQLLIEARTYEDLYDKELRILAGNWTEEADGAGWIDPNHDFAHDLDLFGKGSLFQYLNRTATKEGAQKLADKLQSLSLDPEDIKMKQEAVVELAQNAEFREQFFVTASIVEEGRKKKKEFDIGRQPELSFISGGLKYAIMAFPFISVLVILLSSFKMIHASSVIYLFLGGLGATAHYFRKVNLVHNEVSMLGRYLSQYARLIGLVEDFDVKASHLNRLKSQLTINGQAASQVVRKLGKIIQFFDQRLNMLMGAILNGFFLWDLLVCVALKKWYAMYGSQLKRWIEALNEIEALNSLGTFAYNHPECCLPQFSKDIVLEASDLGHPLIPLSERVNNNFSINGDKRICVVTGANMAGKSTFLRTVGVNLVLAGNGCVVTAKKFRHKPLVFITNMRAIDNLLKHESYFFAELSRLQMIVERLKNEGELFFILDEILKGTNSFDKTSGSKALVQHLVQLNGSGIVATHDLELGQLAQEYPGKIFNNCFEVSFEGDNLNFDYKLREGVTQSHNASFLMRKMGLIPVD